MPEDIRNWLAKPTVGGLTLARRGYASESLSTTDTPFTIGVTRPTFDNTGPDPTVVRHAWTTADGGTLASNGVLTVSTANKTFNGVDFGNIRVKPTAANVTFNNCTWLLTSGEATPPIDARSTTHSNIRVYRCDINNSAQNAFMTNGIVGDRFTLERSRVRNFQDLVGFYASSTNVDGPVNVQILGNFLTDLAFWWAPTVGIVHPSDTQGHHDVIQHQGGRGAIIRGNFIGAYYSTTIGTGTPGSGSDFGWTGVSYTQAEGAAKRQEIVYGNGTLPKGDGGSIAGIMMNNTRGGTPVVQIYENWGGGGGYWLNAGETWTAASGIVNNFGEVHHNIVKRDQRFLSGGLPVVFGIDVTGVASVFENYEANIDWTKNLAKPIARQNA